MAWILRIYRTCNSTVRFSKYEFYNKLLGSVTLLRVTPSITWTQPIYIYIYIYIIYFVSHSYTLGFLDDDNISFCFSISVPNWREWRKFNYKICRSLKLQLYSISFYWRWILTNPQLDYIFLLYPPCLQNF